MQRTKEGIMRQIPYVNFPAQFAEEKAELMAIAERVLSTGMFVGGPEVDALENDLVKVCNTRYVVALNSGTDALVLGMKVLGIGPGDEVITPPNSFVSSTAAIVAVGATPVFADVCDDQNIDPAAVEMAISPKTKAIMPVHLTGRIANMDILTAIAKKYGLAIVEDAAQSFGSKYNNAPSGSFGNIGCFSAHPLKNLNAVGDAGFVTTNDKGIADRLRLLRNHGLADRNTVVEWGTVSRMDTLQAAILRYRLTRLDGVIQARRENAKRYSTGLANQPVFIPPCQPHEYNTFHVFVIQVDRRDELIKYLKGCGIETGIHYPIPIHLQPVATDMGYKVGSMPNTERQAGRILSLPINQYVSAEDIDWVIAGIKEFYK